MTSSSTNPSKGGVILAALFVMLTVAGCVGPGTSTYEVKSPSFVDHRNITSTTAPQKTTTSTAALTSPPSTLFNSSSSIGENVSTSSTTLSTTSSTLVEARVVDMGAVVPSLSPPNTVDDSDIPDMVCLSRATVKKVLNLRPTVEGPGQGPWFEAKKSIIEIEGLKSTKFFEGPSRVGFYFSQFNTTLNKTTGSPVNSSALNPGNKLILVNGSTPDPNATYIWNSTTNRTVIKWDALKNQNTTTTTTLSG